MRNFALFDDRVDRLIRYWLTPVCGGYMPDQSMTEVLAANGIARDEVTAVRYRGFGCPGPTTITLADGARREIDYLDFWGEDESS